MPAPLLRMRGPLVGIAWMVAGMIIVPLMDGIVKYLVQYYPALEVVWARYFFHFVFLFPLVLWRMGWRAFAVGNPKLQLLRSGLMVISTTFFANAVARLPFADTIALTFIAPLVVTMLSPWLLGERVSLGRWLAVITGFVGALVVIRPGFADFNWGYVLALCCGTCYALYLVATRKLAGAAAPIVTLAFTASLGALVMSALMPFVGVMPTLPHLGLMMLAGLISAGGHFLLIKAFDHAPASLLSPLVYLQIATATVFGYLVFGQLPDAVTWIGIAVIVGSGVYNSVATRQS